MKKEYVKPMMESETFTSNDYVAACYTLSAKLYCAIPGKSINYVNDGIIVGKWNGDNGVWHGGPCATNTAETLTGINGSFVGTESGGNGLTDCTIGESVSGLDAYVTSNIGTVANDINAGYYKASWTSKDSSGLIYKHYGIAQITSALTKPGYPNHS